MITTDIERILRFGTDEQKANLLTLFKCKNPNIDHGDFMSFISDIFAYAVQYGHRGYMCDVVQSEYFKESGL